MWDDLKMDDLIGTREKNEAKVLRERQSLDSHNLR